MNISERKRQKLKEISRKVAYMRANSPPKALLNSTSRLALVSQNKELARAVPSKTADQLIEKGILRDDYYNHLKQTLHSPSRSTQSRPVTSSTQRLPSPAAPVEMQDWPMSPLQETQPIEPEDHPPAVEAPNLMDSPLVQLLATKGLTKQAALRKTQTRIRDQLAGNVDKK